MKLRFLPRGITVLFFAVTLLVNSAVNIGYTSNVRGVPHFHGDSTERSVAENEPSGTEIGDKVRAHSETPYRKYVLRGTDAGTFDINDRNGQLTTTAPLDYETKDTYQVIVVIQRGSIDPLSDPVSGPIIIYEDRDSINVTIRVTNVRDSVISDENLADEIRSSLDLEDNHDISAEMLLELENLSAKDERISDLTGLEHATNLTGLNLMENTISDIRPIANLTNLTVLNLKENTISDIRPLANLTNLTLLDLKNNTTISDVSPIANLTNLTILYLSGNAIRNLSSLKDLIELTELGLSNNTIRDVSPLKDLTNLTKLWLRDNTISDTSPIYKLVVEHGCEVDIGVSPFPSEELDAYVREKLNIPDGADITPRALRNLTWLFANRRGIGDLTGLELATNLEKIDAIWNGITDLTPLSGLTNLIRIDLRWNRVNYVDALSNLTNLKELQLHDNPVLDTSPLHHLLVQNGGILVLDIAPSSYPAWDVNEDGNVDATDVALVTANLGRVVDRDDRTDVDGNLVVNERDLQFVNDNLDPESEDTEADAEADADAEETDEDTEADADAEETDEDTEADADAEETDEDTEADADAEETDEDTEADADAEETEADIEDGEAGVLMPDANLAMIVRAMLKISDDEPLTVADMLHLRRLNATEIGISDLTGLQHATNLAALLLAYNSVSSLTPLSNLTNLTELDLSNNSINDVSALSGLTNLTTLYLEDNSILDTSPLWSLLAANGGNLSTVDITIVQYPPWDVNEDGTVNNVDLSLVLAALLEDSPENSRTDVNGDGTVDNTDVELVRTHANLDTVDTEGDSEDTDADTEAEGDSVDTDEDAEAEADSEETDEDAEADRDSLANDTETVTGTQIPLGSIVHISDTNLEAVIRNLLELEGDADITVADMLGLTQLNAANQGITDLTGLEHATNLERVWLGRNVIADLSPLSSLTNLTHFSLGRGELTNISALSGLTNLIRLYLSNNFISDVSALSGLTNLTILYLENNSILDTSPLWSLLAANGGNLSTVDITIVQYPPWDVNEDGSVDETDSALVTAALGQSGEDIVNSRTDVNGNDTVDADDLTLVTDNLDAGAAAPSGHGVLTLLDRATLESLDPDTLASQLANLRAKSDGSLKYQRAIALLESVLAAMRPAETQLLANYPNPFNPETWLPYHLANPSEVVITIYDMRGHVVRRLDLGHQREGYYTSRSRAAYWDGRNDLGERVASSLYFYHLQADNLSLLRKMVILK